MLIKLNISLFQVHDRIQYLTYLIDSFAKVSDINKALLIFSHDVYDEEINDMILSIKFCKVMQVRSAIFKNFKISYS